MLEPIEEPPLAAVYQLTVPAEGVAARTTVPVPQRLAGVEAVIVGFIFMVATTAVLEDEPHALVACT